VIREVFVTLSALAGLIAEEPGAGQTGDSGGDSIVNVGKIYPAVAEEAWSATTGLAASRV
jgi:hypothetical protein